MSNKFKCPKCGSEKILSQGSSIDWKEIVCGGCANIYRFSDNEQTAPVKVERPGLIDVKESLFPNADIKENEKACPEKTENRCNIDGHICVDETLCNTVGSRSYKDRIAELEKQLATWKDNENGQNILRSKYRRILISLGLTDEIDVQIIHPDCNTNTTDAIAKKYFIDKMIADKEEIREQLEDHYYKQIKYLQDTLATAKADNEALRKQYNDRDYHLNSCQEGMAALRENYDAVNKQLEEYRKKHNKNMAEIENLHKVISKLGEQL